MTSISVADCKEDRGYLSDFCNVHFKPLPLDTEDHLEMKPESSKGNEMSTDELKTKITGLTKELNEMKEFMADKMKKQVKMMCHIFYERKSAR